MAITAHTTVSGSLNSATANGQSTLSEDFESFFLEMFGAVQARLSSDLNRQQRSSRKVSTLEKEIASALDLEASRIYEVSSKVEELGSQLAEVESRNEED